MEYTPNLRKKYSDQIVSNLKGNYKSVMQVPKLVKICLNQGLGSASSTYYNEPQYLSLIHI